MDDDPSNDVIRKQVKKVFTKLTSKLDPTGFILDLLFERDIIDLDQKSSIEELAKKEDRCSKLLGYLFKSTSADAFVVFRESLRNDYPEFANNIDNVCKMEAKHIGLLNKHRKVLLRCIDCNCLFLSCLISRGILDPEQEQQIKAEMTQHNRNSKLIGILIDCPENKTGAFIDALCETEQEHIANLLTDNLNEKYPLSEEDVRRLEKIKPTLLRIMDSHHSGLCDHLISMRIVSEVDLDTIKSKTTSFDRNDAIVGALLRRSREDYTNFKTALIDTNQPHVAKFLNEGAAVGVHIHTSHPERDDELANLCNDNNLNELSARLQDMNLNIATAIPGQSIVVYFYFNTVEAAISLLNIVHNGELEEIMEDILNNITEDTSLRVVSLHLDPEEEDICYEYIRECIASGGAIEVKKMHERFRKYTANVSIPGNTDSMKESNAPLTENTDYHQSPRSYPVNDMTDEFETYSIANDELPIQSDIPNAFNSQNENDQLLQRDCDFEKLMLTPTESDKAAKIFYHDICILQMCKDEYDRIASQTETDILEQIDECEIVKLLEASETRFSEFDSPLCGNPYYSKWLTTPHKEFLRSTYPRMHDILQKYEGDLKTTMSRIENLITLHAEKYEGVRKLPTEEENMTREITQYFHSSHMDSDIENSNSKTLVRDLRLHCKSMMYTLIPIFKQIPRTEKKFIILETIDQRNLKVRNKSDKCVYLIHKIGTSVFFHTDSRLNQAPWNKKVDQNQCNKALFWFHNNDSTDIGINRYVEKLSQLNHKNVIKYITSWSETPNQPYFTSFNKRRPAGFEVFMNIQTESHVSQTLRHRIEEGFKGNSEKVLLIFFEIVSGLAHIHKLGIVHGDLNADSIFIDSEDHVKIGNFNLDQSCKIQLPIDLECFFILEEQHAQFGLFGERREHPYTQKSDIFRLGVILFEMFFEYGLNNRQKIEILKSLKSASSMHPQDSAIVSDERQRALILWLLNNDPLVRPTAEELMCIKDILLTNTSEINEWLRFTRNEQNTDLFKSFIKALSNKAISPSIGNIYVTWLVASVSILHYDFESMVRMHGARKFVVPELHTDQVLESNEEFFWINRRREDISLLYDQRIAFARYIANRNIDALKVYSIEEPSEYSYRHLHPYDPEQTIGGSFDIVTTYSESTMMHTAEVMWFGVQLIRKYEKINASIYIRLNHTDLFHALLVNCEIPKNLHKEIHQILQIRGEKMWSPFELMEQLRSLLGDTFSQKFCELVSKEIAVDQLEAVFASVSKVGGENSWPANNALREIKELVGMLKELLESTVDVKNLIKFHFGVVNNFRCYSGIVFQIVSTNLDILAVGGRYDKLIEFHKERVPFKLSNQKRQMAVGITVPLKLSKQPQKKIRSNVADVFVVSVGADRFVNQLKVANILWSKGISALIYDYDLHGNAESMKAVCMSHGIKYVIYRNQSDNCLLAKLDSEEHAARILSKGASEKMINLIEYEINLEKTKIQNRQDSTREKTSIYFPGIEHEKERTTDPKKYLIYEGEKTVKGIEGRSLKLGMTADKDITEDPPAEKSLENLF